MRVQRFLCVVFIVLAFAAQARIASAQAYTGDARTVGMGGGGDNLNIAGGMVAPEMPYTAIPIPLGLIQVFGNIDQFNPSSDKFDPVRAIELAASPVHYEPGRSADTTGDPLQRFVNDLVNGRLNRDLSTYRGIDLPDTIEAEGLMSTAWGPTFKFAKKPTGAFQGIFVGAGPYLSIQTNAVFDEKLRDILSSDTAKYFPNTQMLITDEATVQLAMSIVFGYRARFALPGSAAEGNDGVYVAANYRYLKGFEYLEPDTGVRFDTDANGLITINPSTAPIQIDNLEGKSGKGRAVDVGFQVVRNQWQAGFGVNGIGNSMTWHDIERKRFTLNSLTTGGDFVDQTLAPPFEELDVDLPVVTTGNVKYDGGNWAAQAVAVNGYNGSSFHGGGERRFGGFAVRGGARLSRGFWDPTYGFGIGSKKVALDVGFFGTHGNLEEKQRTAIAISLRINPTK